MPKKNTLLYLILDIYPINTVTIKNTSIGPFVDEFAKAFARRIIY